MNHHIARWQHYLTLSPADRAILDQMEEEMDDELKSLIEESKRRVAAMTPAEREAMFEAQRASWVRSVVYWPNPNFEWVNGVKVYASFEDYCND